MMARHTNRNRTMARRWPDIVTGQLACGFAHDLNNLLTVVLGFSSLQLRQLGDRHPLRPDLGHSYRP